MGFLGVCLTFPTHIPSSTAPPSLGPDPCSPLLPQTPAPQHSQPGCVKAEGIPRMETWRKELQPESPKPQPKSGATRGLRRALGLTRAPLLPRSPQGVQEPQSIQELPNISSKAGDCGFNPNQPQHREEERNMWNKTKPLI